MEHARSNHPVLTMIVALAAIVFVHVPVGAQTGSRTWTDGDFTNWTRTSMGTAGATASMAVRSSGGNPGAYAAATVSLPGPNQTGCLAMTNNSAVWDPVIDGPICLVRLRIDVQSDTGWGQGQWLRPLVAQNGRLFVAPGGNTGPSQSWHTLDFGPYPAGAFMSIWPPNPAAHPDFSVSGAPLTMGFAVINSSDPNGGYVYTQNYDNWQAVAYPGSRAQRLTMGVGCGSTTPVLTSGYPVLGAGVGISITDAPPTRSGGLFAGLLATTPWPLGPRCHVYLDPAFGLFLATPLSTDAAGQWSSRLVFPPDPALCGTMFALQAAIFPTPAPVGLDLTNGLLYQIGG